MKVLTDKRGPLQGVDIESVLRSAYGPDATLETDSDSSEFVGHIVREGEVIDTVINLQD